MPDWIRWDRCNEHAHFMDRFRIGHPTMDWESRRVVGQNSNWILSANSIYFK